MRLFLYGTLLDPAVLTRHAGRPLRMTPADLPGWQRVRLRGTPYPTLVPGPGRTRGAVVRVDPRALRGLRRYEGPRYRLLPVAPLCAGRRMPAHAWIGDAPTRRPWP